MTIAFLPWPTSIYIKIPKSACELPDGLQKQKSMDRFPSYSTLY